MRTSSILPPNNCEEALPIFIAEAVKPVPVVMVTKRQPVLTTLDALDPSTYTVGDAKPVPVTCEMRLLHPAASDEIVEDPEKFFKRDDP